LPVSLDLILKSGQMEVYSIEKDLKVFGTRVHTFPDGIGKAFDSLVSKFEGAGEPRQYYGISYMEDGKIVYMAMVEQHDEKNEDLVYEQFIISKGDYLSILIKDWRSKTSQINQVFHSIMEDARADHQHPCLEIYKNDEEMLCLVRMVDQLSKVNRSREIS
jgi:predicted transcriptional regulator YdeE